MIIKTIVRPNEYRSSILLMGASKKIQELDGIEQSLIVMATDPNKTLLQDLGLFTVDAQTATPNDMVIVMKAAQEEAIERAIAALDGIFQERAVDAGDRTIRTLEAALQAMPNANLAFISVPGEYAAREARKALEHNLHVFLFSDNVPISEEAALKRLAQEKGVLMMGADCGVALINNVALGIASPVKQGPIGIVGASGSGIQEVTILVEREGLGVSQAIGTGGRDLSDSIGGISMLQGLDALEKDENTRVIVLVSKPPAPQTMLRVLEAVTKCRKPVVVNFLGGDPAQIAEAGAIPATTLEDAALRAVHISKNLPFQEQGFTRPQEEINAIIERESAGFQPQQRYIRGLFGGGTFCKEAILLLTDIVGDMNSNTPLRDDLRLRDSQSSRDHTIIDMGAEEFTRGRPHPVIDPEPCLRRLAAEARDPEVAVLLLDFILGYGAHPDPAGAFIGPILQAKADAQQDGRYLAIVASICGSQQNPQDITVQERMLRDAGVILMPSNAQASRLAGYIALRGM